MTAPAYGYLHSATVHSVDPDTGGVYLRPFVLNPTSRRGPVSTCVWGLQPGDRVVVASLGTTRDVILIVGRVGGQLPANIPDLAELLAGKADDSDVAALAADLAAVTADVAAVEGVVDGHTTTLAELDGRLDDAETTLGGHTTTLSSHTATLTTLADLGTDHEARLVRLEHNPIREDRDLYGDLLSTLPRNEATDAVVLTNGTIYLYRLAVRSLFACNQIRMATAVAGVGGTAAVALYSGTVTTSLTQVRSGTISLATLGRVTHTLSSTFNTVAGGQAVVALLPLSYTTAPQLAGRTGVAHSSLINPSTSLAASVTKAGQTTLPASIDLTDGTWAQTGTSVAWTALG